MTSNFPPTDAGIPKSVKQRKNDWMNEAISVPAKGRKIVIIKVETRLSPMILETIMNFLSIYPIVLWISKKDTGSV